MERSKPFFHGISKVVPSVQELAKQPMTTPPPRYIRTDLEACTTCSTTLLGEVPVIDMQKLLHKDDMEVELHRFHLACNEWDFFQVVNHGLSTELVENVKHVIREVFNLPLEEKKKFWQHENEMEGFGQAFVVSDEQKLDRADLFFLTTLPESARKSHLLPKLPSPIREILNDYSRELKNLSMKIIRVMEKTLKTEAKEIEDLFEDGFQSMRMNYYPPCVQPEQVTGLRPHSDATGLTILLQVNEVEGLQIKKEGMWIPINPLSNAFIVNIGDILEIVSNGIYRSMEHQVTINSTKERLSIATFNNPSYETTIRPAKSLITPLTPALFREMKGEDYFRGIFSCDLTGNSYLNAMRIKK